MEVKCKIVYLNISVYMFMLHISLLFLKNAFYSIILQFHLFWVW